MVEDSLCGMPVMGGNVLIYCNLDAFERASRFHGRRIEPPGMEDHRRGGGATREKSKSQKVKTSRRPPGSQHSAPSTQHLAGQWPDAGATDAGWTLEEFVHICKWLTIDEDGDGDVDQFGFLQPHWVYYMPFVWSHGARFLTTGSEDHPRWALRGPEAVSAFAMYANLRHRWAVTPMPIEYAGQNSDTSFLSGRVAMCVNGPWFQAFLRETALKDRYRVVTIPRGPGGSSTRVTWDALCIYAKASPQRRANAWRFVRFVLSSEAQEVFAAYQRAIPARRASAGAYVQAGGGPGSPAEAFIRAMNDVRLQPITPDWQVMGRAIRRHLTSVILEGDARRSPEVAVTALSSDPAIVEAFGGGRMKGEG